MNEELEESRDGSCPKCQSREARIVGKHGAGAGKGGKLPPYEWYTCLCLNSKCGTKLRILSSIWDSMH
jgi:hypothetical protein